MAHISNLMKREFLASFCHIDWKTYIAISRSCARCTIVFFLSFDFGFNVSFFHIPSISCFSFGIFNTVIIFVILFRIYLLLLTFDFYCQFGYVGLTDLIIVGT